METYTIHEYESFTCSTEFSDSSFKVLPKSTFNRLKQFIIENNSSNDSNTWDFMTISFKRNGTEVITAKNYVGVIAMNDGSIIEILPKIAKGNEVGDEAARKILLAMLRTLVDFPCKSHGFANIDVAHIPIFDVFISMFINEVSNLLKKGLKSNYIPYEENVPFLKGKLLFNSHIKHNFAHLERFFIEHHPYNINRPENKLIKTTLAYLYRYCSNIKTKRELLNLLNLFDDIEYSRNLEADFNACSDARDMKNYQTILLWSKIFLRGNSFSNTQGKHLATALLFPMEKLFESYVAQKFRETLNVNRYSLSAQDCSHNLFENIFALRPDIVIKDEFTNNTVVMDTKWKLLDSTKSNFGISQADMYQMYAYGKKYNTDSIILLYPKNNNPEKEVSPKKFDAKEETSNVIVHVRFVDLSQDLENGNCISSIVEEFFQC